ncbi:hypothetical protein OXPF_40460 [Oxobacter pfennigii]|uniref:Uncharacterized protein n=1 Tax=Oxobacter pfennigii TaxID=36849 RepID=A0A0P8W3U0_9CLOT|nr:hypothetical protein [Oxobacter pfennigii]KPU42261.1 hypothetical protein OXPF_40460 [Oxobacter pfennigii]
MKKLLFYIPAIMFILFYGIVALSGFSVISPVVAIWLLLWFISGFLLNKNYFWGSLLGTLPAIHLVYMGTQETGQIISEASIGIVVLIFYLICGYWIYRKNIKLSHKL